jgi:hypothetical protein
VWIDNQFPNIKTTTYKTTSSASEEYNCVAWAVGDITRWWSNIPGYYWPTINRSSLVESLVDVFAAMGYEICDSTSLEEDFDKVAIYKKAGLWKHVSRQLVNGHWTSKLGAHEDIEHESPEVLVGDLYGTVHCIMRKKRI